MPGALRLLLLVAAAAGAATAAVTAGSAPDTAGAVRDLRTKEQRLYEIQLREAQWKVDVAQLDMETKLSDYEENKELFEQNIRPLDQLNQSQRAYLQAKLAYDKAMIDLEQTRLSFLRAATHISIVEAKKHRTPDGNRQVEITLENASNLRQALSLNPEKSPEEVRALLEIQNLKVSIQGPGGLVVGEPYEVEVPSLRLSERQRLTFRLLDDLDAVTVAVTTLEGQPSTYHIVLRKESLQDFPIINSVQFSQEGELNTRVRYDLILERLAEDVRTFRLAVVNLPAEISFAFLDQATNASLTQVKFSEEATRQQLELELQIPEKLSRSFIDRTLEFFVLVTDEEGFQHLGRLNRHFGSRPLELDSLRLVAGSRERFELIPRGKGALETVVANRFQEVKIGQEVTARVEVLNTGTLEVTEVHLILTPPLGWSCVTSPDTIDHIVPGEKEPVNIKLLPPDDLGVSEYDVRVEAAGYVGEERVEATEKDITVRVEARANLVRNALVIGGVILLVVGVAVGSIRVSRR
ncbi:MAG: NEW3 domain-containing protein [Candidatus Latescibacterota bacterium]